MAGRGRPALKAEDGARPLLYTGQDVARFCEVDLKTIHHWADRGRIPHHRTEGRHLRFRRNDVVRFLRAHTYPIPDDLAGVRPQVALAPLPGAQGEAPQPARAWPLTFDDLVRRLSARFIVRKQPSAIVAVARALVLGTDALVVPLDDPELGAVRTIAALKAAPETAWIAIVAVGADVEGARAAGAEVALLRGEIERMPRELAKALALTSDAQRPSR
jgi:excisionase family DNA binding protein